MDEKMSRRTAIKTIGTAAIGAMLSMSGVSALASCVSMKKKRIILYFTGTGNCLYVARQLADEDTQLLSIPQMMNQGRMDFEADEIGLVLPQRAHPCNGHKESEQQERSTSKQLIKTK